MTKNINITQHFARIIIEATWSIENNYKWYENVRAMDSIAGPMYRELH